MSTNCVRCVTNDRTGPDLLCDECRRAAAEARECVVALIFDALDEAEKKHPGFPTDPYIGMAVVLEEVGESSQALLQRDYEGGTTERFHAELLQMAAVSIRMCLYELTAENRPPANGPSLCMDCGRHAGAMVIQGEPDIGKVRCIPCEQKATGRAVTRTN